MLREGEGYETLHNVFLSILFQPVNVCRFVSVSIISTFEAFDQISRIWMERDGVGGHAKSHFSIVLNLCLALLSVPVN
jgi:hypothetical protein